MMAFYYFMWSCAPSEIQSVCLLMLFFCIVIPTRHGTSTGPEHTGVHSRYSTLTRICSFQHFMDFKIRWANYDNLILALVHCRL